MSYFFRLQGIKIYWLIQFLGYLRTLSLKFQKARTKIEVVLTLHCWLSQLQGRPRTTSILVRKSLRTFWLKATFSKDGLKILMIILVSSPKQPSSFMYYFAHDCICVKTGVCMYLGPSWHHAYVLRCCLSQILPIIRHDTVPGYLDNILFSKFQRCANS